MSVKKREKSVRMYVSQVSTLRSSVCTQLVVVYMFPPSFFLEEVSLAVFTVFYTAARKYRQRAASTCPKRGVQEERLAENY